MFSLNGYRLGQFILFFIMAGGMAVWYSARPPEGSSVGAVLGDVERIGRAHEMVLETVEAVRRLSAVGHDAPDEDVTRRRGHVQQAIESSRKLAAELETVNSPWIPVGEATILLNDCGKVGELTLARSPVCQAPATGKDTTAGSDDLDLGPNHREMSAESVQIVETRARQLLGGWRRLESRCRQTIVGGMLARGNVFGFESTDLLLATTVLGCLLGIAMLSRVRGRLNVSPAKIERMEIELIARTDRRAAVRRCHERVSDLLRLADGFCRGQGI